MENSKKNESSSSNNEKPVLEKLLEIDEQVAQIMASDMLMAGVDTVSFYDVEIISYHQPCSMKRTNL